MIEPTESESKEELDLFIDAMRQIAREAEENPEVILSAPHGTRVFRAWMKLAGRAQAGACGGCAPGASTELTADDSPAKRMVTMPRSVFDERQRRTGQRFEFMMGPAAWPSGRHPGHVLTDALILDWAARGVLRL